MKRLASLALLCLALLALFAIGCGGDDDSGGAADDAKKVDTAAAENAKGNVSWCIGKDTSGAYQDAIDGFKKENSAITVKLVELPESADEQRNQLVQRLRAKSSECDVLGLDVIWTAEFAAQGWLTDVSDAIEQNKADFIPSTLETAKYEDKYFAIPMHSNAGFVYYRSDQVDQAPTTWEDLYKEAASGDGLVYQGARYEGLTVNFLELLYSGGGKVLSDDGKTVEVDSEQGKAALTFMADGFKNGATKKAVTTYKEEESRRAFESGKATFMRNWPYAYPLGKKSKIKDDFDITNFPGFAGGEGASVLGGINLGISAYSKNPDAALAFANYAVSPEFQTQDFPKVGSPPAAAAPYDDANVQKEIPFAADLKKAIEQGQSRPVTPVYAQVSEAIYENVHDALQGKQQPDAALSKMKSDIEKALQTF